MSRKLIIDGNAVYEIDEECMLKNRLDTGNTERENRRHSEKDNRKDFREPEKR